MVGLESPGTAQGKPLWESKGPPSPREHPAQHPEGADVSVLEKAQSVKSQNVR